MAKAGRGDDQYMVRFPPGLRNRIKEEAEKSGRSMNSEIIARLEASFLFSDTDAEFQSVLADYSDGPKTDGLRTDKPRPTQEDTPLNDLSFGEETVSDEPMTRELFRSLFGDMRKRLDRIEQKLDRGSEDRDEP